MADGSQFAFTPAVEAATLPLWEKVKHHVTRWSGASRLR